MNDPYSIILVVLLLWTMFRHVKACDKYERRIAQLEGRPYPAVPRRKFRLEDFLWMTGAVIVLAAMSFLVDQISTWLGR